MVWVKNNTINIARERAEINMARGRTDMSLDLKYQKKFIYLLLLLLFEKTSKGQNRNFVPSIFKLP